MIKLEQNPDGTIKITTDIEHLFTGNSKTDDLTDMLEDARFQCQSFIDKLFDDLEERHDNGEDLFAKQEDDFEDDKKLIDKLSNWEPQIDNKQWTQINDAMVQSKDISSSMFSADTGSFADAMKRISDMMGNANIPDPSDFLQDPSILDFDVAKIDGIDSGKMKLSIKEPPKHPQHLVNMAGLMFGPGESLPRDNLSFNIKGDSDDNYKKWKKDIEEKMHKQMTKALVGKFTGA